MKIIFSIRNLRIFSALIVAMIVGAIIGIAYLFGGVMPKQLAKELTPAKSQSNAYSNNSKIQPENQNATLIVGQDMYEINITNNTTVLDIMKVAKEYSGLKFTVKETPGLGAFVNEINEKSNDTQNKTYWTYYINGQAAQVGVSSYVVKPGDKIEWKYEK